MILCDVPRCRSKREDLKYYGHYICDGCFENLDVVELKALLKIKDRDAAKMVVDRFRIKGQTYIEEFGGD